MIGMTPKAEFTAFQARMMDDPRVLGVILTGSRARENVATSISDYDVLVVVEDGAERDLAVEARRDASMDVSVMPLEEFRRHALPGSGTERNRYAFSHTKILKDSGPIAELVAAKARLSSAEAAEMAPEFLDGFLNCAYRCLKNDRDGNLIGGRLDATEAIPYFLGYVFALHERVRPYNRYLRWELKQHPLSQPEWQHEHLLVLLSEVLTPTASRAIRRMFNELEPNAREAGHGPLLDAWGDDVSFLRGSLP